MDKGKEEQETTNVVVTGGALTFVILAHQAGDGQGEGGAGDNQCCGHRWSSYFCYSGTPGWRWTRGRRSRRQPMLWSQVELLLLLFWHTRLEMDKGKEEQETTNVVVTGG